jgi:hypothetical protein
MESVLTGLAFLIVLVIILIAYLLYKSKYPTYSNNVLDIIKFYQNWQWVNPIISNGDPNTPYVFNILPKNQLQLSYYDNRGYLKGFSTYILDYTIPDVNTVQLTLSSTMINYSKIPPVFPWIIKYIDPQHLTIQINGTSQLLEVL